MSHQYQRSSFRSLLLDVHDLPLRIPSFVRDYVYAPDDAISLIDSMHRIYWASAGWGAFDLGLVTVGRSAAQAPRDLVDGQQRLVTVLAALAAIAELVRSREIKVTPSSARAMLSPGGRIPLRSLLYTRGNNGEPSRFCIADASGGEHISSRLFADVLRPTHSSGMSPARWDRGDTIRRALHKWALERLADKVRQLDLPLSHSPSFAEWLMLETGAAEHGPRVCAEIIGPPPSGSMERSYTQDIREAFLRLNDVWTVD